MISEKLPGRKLDFQSGSREVWAFPLLSERRDRWFESSFPDQFQRVAIIDIGYSSTMLQQRVKTFPGSSRDVASCTGKGHDSR